MNMKFIICTIPTPNDKPIKMAFEDGWSLEDNGNEIVTSKKLSETESKKLLMELFGTTDVGFLDCSNMTEEKIAEINKIADAWNKKA